MSDQLQDHHAENVGSRETHRVKAGHHERFRDPERLESLRPDEFVGQLDLQTGEAVLDLGCGDGVMFGPLSRSVGLEGRVVGIDIDEDMVEIARQTVRDESLENVEVKLADDDNIPLKDESMDAAILVNSLHEMAHPTETLKELARVLKPAGRVLLLDRIKEETGEGGPPKHHLVSREEAVEFFGKAGLTLDETLDWAPKMYTLIFKKE